MQRLYDQIHVSGAAGSATGRNIHQKSLDDAVRMVEAMAAIVVDGAPVADALKVFAG